MNEIADGSSRVSISTLLGDVIAQPWPCCMFDSTFCPWSWSLIPFHRFLMVCVLICLETTIDHTTLCFWNQKQSRVVDAPWRIHDRSPSPRTLWSSPALFGIHLRDSAARSGHHLGIAVTKRSLQKKGYEKKFALLHVIQHDPPKGWIPTLKKVGIGK